MQCNAMQYNFNEGDKLGADRYSVYSKPTTVENKYVKPEVKKH